MRKALTLIFASIALLAHAATPTSPVALKPLKVGIILPLTGTMAAYGQDALDTALLWKKDHPNVPVELVVEDCPLDPSRALSAALKMTQVDKVNALLTVDANTGRVLKRVATKYKAIQICQAWDPKISDGAYNIVSEFQPPDDAAVLMDYWKAKGIKKIAILHMQNVAFTLCADEVAKAAKARDIEVVAKDAFQPGTRDFRIEFLKLQNTKPELLVLLSFSPEMEIIGHQLKQTGWAIPLTSVNSFDQSSEHSLWNGCISVSGMDLKGPYATKFLAFTQRQTTYPGFTYDYLTLLTNAYIQCGGDLTKWPQEVQNTTPFVGIVGSSINDNGTFKYQPYLVKMVDGFPEKMK